MTYEQLIEFVERRMRMSHIYQPVMMLTLLEQGGRSSDTEIAKEISVHDPTQIGRKNGDILVFCVAHRRKTAGFVSVNAGISSRLVRIPS